MAAMPSIKLLMDTPYKGGVKTWSMKFHFSGGLPDTRAKWEALWTDIWVSLKPAIRTDCHNIGAVGYANDTSPSVFADSDHDAGSFNPVAGDPQAAYVAALLYWSTDAHNSRGGPIFLRNFVHGVVSAAGDLDAVVGTQKTDLDTFGHKFSAAGSGFTDGATVYKRAGPNGAVGLDGGCRPFVSHRVLARRG